MSRRAVSHTPGGGRGQDGAGSATGRTRIRPAPIRNGPAHIRNGPAPTALTVAQRGVTSAAVHVDVRAGRAGQRDGAGHRVRQSGVATGDRQRRRHLQRTHGRRAGAGACGRTAGVRRWLHRADGGRRQRRRSERGLRSARLHTQRCEHPAACVRRPGQRRGGQPAARPRDPATGLHGCRQRHRVRGRLGPADQRVLRPWRPRLRRRHGRAPHRAADSLRRRGFLRGNRCDGRRRRRRADLPHRGHRGPLHRP